MSHTPERRSLDDFLAEQDARQRREYEQERIVRHVMNGADDSFYGQSEHGDVLLGVVRRLVTLRMDDAKKWRTLEAALKGLAQEWAMFQTGDK